MTKTLIELKAYVSQSQGDKIQYFLYRHVGSPQGKIQGVIGSPYWISPEVVVSDRHLELAYDTRADVWSLGKIFTCVDATESTFQFNSVTQRCKYALTTELLIFAINRDYWG